MPPRGPIIFVATVVYIGAMCGYISVAVYIRIINKTPFILYESYTV